MTFLDPVLKLLTPSLPVMRRRLLGSRLANDESTIVTALAQIGLTFFSIVLFCLVFSGLFVCLFFYCCCFSHPRSVERIRPNIRPLQSCVFRNPGYFGLWNVLLHFVKPISLYNKIAALYNNKAVVFVITDHPGLCNKICCRTL